MNRSLKVTALSLAIATATAALTACGGGGGGSSSNGSGTLSTSGSTSTTGVISGFGSVFVDGVEFETDSSSFSLDDGDDGQENETSLAVGMVVTVTGTVNADGKTGTATHIEFDDELEGIVNTNSVDTNGTGTMTVMGQTVKVKSTTIFESKVAGISSVDLIAPGNIVEVSGFSSDDGTVYATRIEVKAATHSGEEIELKGIITNLTATTFDIGGQTVDFSSASFDDSIPGSTLSEGLYVEVKSRAGFDGSGNLIVSKIELERDGDKGLDGKEGDDVDLNGVVTSTNSASSFEIDGRKVVITSSTKIKHGSAGNIIVGISLKVEGELNKSGALVAREIELDTDGDIKMEGNLEGVNNPPGTITLFGKTIYVNSPTLLLDKQDENGLVPEHFFSLGNLSSGDFVKVDTYVDPDNGNLVASKLEREDDNGNQGELNGSVESIPGGGILIIAGVRVEASALNLPPVSAGDKVEVAGNFDSGTSAFTATAFKIDD